MEQKLLHKMFNGEATDNELTQIRQWVNADKMNRETFYHERALFDALQLNILCSNFCSIFSCFYY